MIQYHLISGMQEGRQNILKMLQKLVEQYAKAMKKTRTNISAVRIFKISNQIE